MKHSIAHEINQAGTQLLHTLQLFEPSQINQVPFEKSWTAGQVVDHILKSGNGAFEVIHGPSQAAGRKADEKVNDLQALFLDFSIQMQSPTEVVPTDAPLQKDQLLNHVQHLFSKLEQAASALNLEEACTAFEFPGQGALTRLEWLRFFLYHTTRHTRQLKVIYNRLHGREVKTVCRTLTIQAPAGVVWQVLTGQEEHRVWYNAFSEGSYAITTWETGSKITCTDPSGSGITGVICSSEPEHCLDILFTGIVRKGEEDQQDDDAVAINGMHETYRLAATGGATQLHITSDTLAAYFEMMSEAWDKALPLINGEAMRLLTRA